MKTYSHCGGEFASHHRLLHRVGHSVGFLHAVSGYLETSLRIDVGPDSVQVFGETLSISGCPPVSLVWLSSGLRSCRAPREERLERGLLCSK